MLLALDVVKKRGGYRDQYAASRASLNAKRWFHDGMSWTIMAKGRQE